jgi:hypothetical protein
MSQHDLAEVPSSRQGVARRISYSALIRLSVIRQLHVELGIGVGDAVRIAERLLDSGQSRVLVVGQLKLTFDVDALRRNLDHRLAIALESAPSPRRGRPPRKPPS